ncbi:MAG: hypothetical protein AMXMBFR82_39690 [Candidatus Hydrogenedentota bacterium]
MKSNKIPTLKNRILTRIALAAVLAVIGSFSAQSQEAFIAQNGTTSYQIVLSSSAPEPSPSERRAAEELQTYVEQVTGVQVPIADTPPADATAPTIVLGAGPAAQALGVNPTADDLGEQGYVMRTVAPHLVIAGTPAAGTLYGVYEFIEQYLGVRWYAPGATKTPHIDTLPLPEVDKVVQPAFAWRNTSYAWPGRDADFDSHLRNNAGSGGPDNPFGVEYAFDGTCHSYFRFISPGEYFEEHPEYFSEIGGVRRAEETQLCLTNPEVLEIVTEKMLQRMADMPGVRQHNFSQEDWYNYCECENCRAMYEQYGSTGATQFWFVNQLAERTSKQYPEKLIGTLAYTFTEEPPQGMTMHPNVAVWLCHMFPSCDSHPIATCPLDAEYKRRAEIWAENCDHLYLWHYIVDFAHYFNPFPNFRAMASDLRFYHDIGAEGIFLQAMGHGGGGGEFALLRGYYGMKLLWDPDQDPDAVLQDFLQGYYGNAWEPIWSYITMLHDKVENENIHMHLYTNPAQGYLPDGLVATANDLLDQAEAAVQDDAELLERVRVARMPVTYARIFPRNGYTLENGKLRFLGDMANMEETTGFIERMKAHGFETIREWGGDPQQLTMWAFAGMMGVPYERIENDRLMVDVLPAFGGRALRVIHRDSAECVTAYNTARTLFFPFAGGEETRMGTTFEATRGTSLVPFTVEERGDDRLSLVADFQDITLRRILTLEPGAAVLTVTNEVENRSDKPTVILIRSHLELDLGSLMRTEVAFINKAGESVARGMQPIVDGLREGEAYRDQNAPNGVWSFTGSKGLQVTQHFDPNQVDYTWLCAYPASLEVLETEVWAKSVTLPPGETMTFTTALEVDYESSVQ